jgi:transcriptional regulator of arginine metabolism
MPSPDAQKRQQRQAAILKILGEGVQVESQNELVEILKQRGVQATQSSVSRDLEDLGAMRVKGLYRLDAWEGFQRDAELLGAFSYALRAENAGHNMTVMATDPGAAQMVAAAIRKANWPEVVGVLADDSTLFIATRDFNALKLLMRRIRILLRESNKLRPVSRAFEPSEERRGMGFSKDLAKKEDQEPAESEPGDDA